MKIHSEKCEAHPNHKNSAELWIALYISLCRQVSIWNESSPSEVWRSKKHSDGELVFGGTWFVLGINHKKGEQIAYHLPIERWDECAFAEELERAPEWDGHTSDDVLERIGKL